MRESPILIFQMQRMGDLVLSFPLLGWLARLFPGHPLWVAGEKMFFDPLMPLSPPVTYFNHGEEPDFTGISFRAVINLSHRPEAAALAGRVKSDVLIGPYRDARGRLLIKGDWQLYRASLTHNNRYNRYHWADLNALDIIPASLMLRTAWPPARPLPGQEPGGPMSGLDPAGQAASGQHAPGEQASGPAAAPPKGGARIGLFLGASEPDKHPDAGFWTTLTRRLLRDGHKPALLGGPAEEALGAAVAGSLKAHSLNLCGRFSVSALARFISELDLFITPDTGPMHIAAWTGTPVLNLSLGPVNPWETGPFSPGHHVVRSSLDCAGCWRCAKKTVECKQDMTAGKVASLVEALLAGRRPDAAFSERTGAGLELLRTRRGLYGLYDLEELFRFAPRSREAGTGEPHAVRRDVSRFWTCWFGALFGRFTNQEDAAAWAALRSEHPETAEQVRSAAAALAVSLVRGMRGGPAGPLEDADFWMQAPPVLRPLSGYIQMYAQNALGGRAALLHSLSLLERVADLPG